MTSVSRMMRLTIFLLLFCFYSRSQEIPSIRILDVSRDSQINTLNFKNLQFIERGHIALDSIFKPIKGNYTVYRYLISDSLILISGPTANKELTEYILIIQIDDNNQVVDGYFYNLNNPEYAYCALYRIKNRKLKFKTSMKFNKLKIRLFEFYEGYTCESFSRKGDFKNYNNLKMINILK